MLHAIHYYMGSLITFSPDCAANIYANCDNLDVPQEPYLSSRLLNRQLKYVMHRIHKDITREVLESLEKSMRSRTKDTWGPNFCSILVLCLCIEGLQTAADTFVVCDIKKEGAASEFKREQSWQACEAVEDYPFQKCTSLFHEIYRSSKVGNGGAREGGFNPLRAMEVGAETGLDSDAATEWMVREIYTMVYNCRKLIFLDERCVGVANRYQVKRCRTSLSVRRLLTGDVMLTRRISRPTILVGLRPSF
jgi:hypothetical protein